MSVIRIQKQKNFSIISNIPLNDKSISFKAKGIWAYLMSKPDDWEVRVSNLINTSTEGKTAIYSGINELVRFGYLEKTQLRDKNGRMIGIEYSVHEDRIQTENQTAINEKTGISSQKVIDLPFTENPDTVNPDTVNVPQLKTDRIQKTERTKRNDDVRQVPSQEPPKPQQKKPSPSFSSSEKIKNPKTNPKDNSKDIQSLLELIPEDMRKPSIENKIKQAVAAGIALEIIKGCIMYSNDQSDKKTWQRYRSHLGKCIDNQWGEGYIQDAGKEDQAQAFLESRRSMPDSVLQLDAARGCQVSAQVLKERGNAN